MDNNIFIIGDLHSNFKPVYDFFQRNPSLMKIENKIMICLGDFGGNYFFDYRDDNFKKALGKYNLTYFVIRGNHEQRPSICAAANSDKWSREAFFGNMVYVENEYPYIKYAADFPALYDINGYKTLVIPGAYSVDKFYRIAQGWSWFKNEQLSEEEMEKGKFLLNNLNWDVDIVLSHTCPIFFEPTDLFISCIDQSTVDKTMERYLGEIEYKLDYKVWLWGHYHSFRDYPRTDGRKRIMLSAGKEVVELEQIINNDTIERI